MGAISPDLLDEAIRTTEELLDRLERERSGIDKRMTEIREHLRKLLDQKSGQQSGNGALTGKRRRKGENARTILALYERDPNAALTKQEIADRTGLPFSSVQAILDKDDSGLSQEGGLWRRKKTGQ